MLHWRALVVLLFAASNCQAQSARTVRYHCAKPRPKVVSRQQGSGYRLGPGDVLAVVVDGVLGDFHTAPVHVPNSRGGLQAGMGYPITIRDDGTVRLPLIEPVRVNGLTDSQAQATISRAYIQADILKRRYQVIATLLYKRRVRVTVVHDDAHDRFQRSRGYGPYAWYASPRRRISVVELPADQATVLDALGAAGAPFDASKVLRDQRQ